MVFLIRLRLPSLLSWLHELMLRLTYIGVAVSRRNFTTTSGDGEGWGGGIATAAANAATVIRNTEGADITEPCHGGARALPCTWGEAARSRRSSSRVVKGARRSGPGERASSGMRHVLWETAQDNQDSLHSGVEDPDSNVGLASAAVSSQSSISCLALCTLRGAGTKSSRRI